MSVSLTPRSAANSHNGWRMDGPQVPALQGRTAGRDNTAVMARRSVENSGVPFFKMEVANKGGGNSVS